MMEIRKTEETRIQLLRFKSLSFMIAIPEERKILELDLCKYYAEKHSESVDISPARD